MSLLGSAYSPSTNVEWIGYSYEPVLTGSKWSLQLGEWTIGNIDDPDDLKPIAELHDSMRQEIQD